MTDALEQFVAEAIKTLRRYGYTVHTDFGRDEHGVAHPVGAIYWFTWAVPGSDAQVPGDAHDSELAAWSEALQHRLANSDIQLPTGSVEVVDLVIVGRPPAG